MKLKIIFFTITLITSCNMLKTISNTDTKIEDNFFNHDQTHNDQIPQSSLYDNLITFYDFETLESGNTVFPDSHGENHLISISAVPLLSDATVTNGQFGRAMSCTNLLAATGGPYRFEVTAPVSLDFSTSEDFTIAFWVRRNSGDPGSGFAIIQFDDFNNFYITDSVSNGELYIDMTSSNFLTLANFFNSSAANSWQHFAIRVDRDLGFSECVNGVCSALQGSPTGASIAVSTLKLCSDFFDGEIDSLGIWNRLLTDSEISDLQNGTPGLDY